MLVDYELVKFDALVTTGGVCLGTIQIRQAISKGSARETKILNVPLFLNFGKSTIKINCSLDTKPILLDIYHYCIKHVFSFPTICLPFLYVLWNIFYQYLSHGLSIS